MYANPLYWPMMWYAMWMNAVMAPWAAVAKGGLPPAAAAIPAGPADPAAVAGLDPVSPRDLQTSATEFR